MFQLTFLHTPTFRLTTLLEDHSPPPPLTHSALALHLHLLQTLLLLFNAEIHQHISTRRHDLVSLGHDLGRDS